MVCEQDGDQLHVQVEGASVRKGVGSPAESVAWFLRFSEE